MLFASSLLTAGPDCGSLDSEDVGLDETPHWGMEGFLLPLDPEDFPSEFWLFPLLLQHDTSRFLTNCLCLNQFQRAAGTA